MSKQILTSNMEISGISEKLSILNSLFKAAQYLMADLSNYGFFIGS